MKTNKQGQTKGKGALALIFAIVFLDLLGVNLIVPVQAFLVRQYDTDALTVSFGVSESAA